MSIQITDICKLYMLLCSLPFPLPEGLKSKLSLCYPVLPPVSPHHTGICQLGNNKTSQWILTYSWWVQRLVAVGDGSPYPTSDAGIMKFILFRYQLTLELSWLVPPESIFLTQHYLLQAASIACSNYLLTFQNYHYLTRRKWMSLLYVVFSADRADVPDYRLWRQLYRHFRLLFSLPL